MDGKSWWDEETSGFVIGIDTSRSVEIDFRGRKEPIGDKNSTLEYIISLYKSDREESNSYLLLETESDGANKPHTHLMDWRQEWGRLDFFFF